MDPAAGHESGEAVVEDTMLCYPECGGTPGRGVGESVVGGGKSRGGAEAGGAGVAAGVVGGRWDEVRDRSGRRM